MSFWGKKSKKKPEAKKGGNAELDKQIIDLMDKLSIPKSGRAAILKKDDAMKLMMIEQFKIKLAAEENKKKESGRDWSKKFNNTKVEWKLLKEFEVVIKDSDAKFAEEFIQELGLKRLCRISRDNRNNQFDTQILLIFKSIIDVSEDIVKDMINDDQTVTTIVSKVDADDNRVRELAIKLLVTLLIVEDDNLSLLASSKIMASLLDSARMRGYRNRWKSIISHISVNEISGGGSYEFDMYAFMLINFIISSLETIEERTDERRLLNSLKFSQSVTDLEKAIENTMRLMNASQGNESGNSTPTPINSQTGASLKAKQRRMSNHQFQMVQFQYCQSLLTQITAYKNLREEDLNELKEQGIIDDENDLSSPKGLFKVLHDQALDDGYINELTSILKNLITIPASGDIVWINISKIVKSACEPTQSQYKLNTKAGADGSSSKSTYLGFKELQHLLKVQSTEEEKEKEEKANNDQTAKKLEEERKKVSDLEKQVSELQEKINSGVGVGGGGGGFGGGGGGGLPPPFAGGGLPPPNGGGGLPPPAPVPGGGGGLPPPAPIPGGGGLPPPAPVPAAAADDGLGKYRKMLKMKLPKQAILNKMKQDGISMQIMQKFELTGALPEAPGGGAAPAPAPAPAAVPDGLDKYRKMVKMKLPKQAVLNKMKQDGISRAIMQKYELTGQLPAGGGGAAPAPVPGLPPPVPSAAAGPTLTKEEEVKLAKYSKMKKMKLPENAIRNKMRQDGIDAGLIDKFFGKGGGGGGKGAGPPPKPKPVKPKWPENLKRKPEIKPSRKMKNLQWSKVDPFSVEKSIWKECDDTKIKFDKKELENMFGQKIIAKKAPKAGSSAKKKKETVEKIYILEGKRSYNIEIFLGRLKMDPYLCKDILLKMDEQKFNAEQVSKLKNFVPTPEEAGMFGGLEPGDEKNLAKAEKFFYTIKNIDKNLPQRLELWAFKMQFDTVLKVETDKVNALIQAHKCIKTSKSLRELFSTILAFGNYMNGGTKKGQAHGFKLQSLSQLTRSRSTDTKTTLMEYLYLYLEKKNPKLLKFVDEWAPLDQAVSVDVPTLRANMAQIGAKLNIINNRCKAAETNSIAGDKFPSVMKPFYASASKKFEKVKKDHEQLMKDLAALAVYLNEKNDKTGQFLKTLNEFRKQFKFTIKQCLEKKAREEKKRKREEAKLNKQKSRKTGSNQLSGLKMGGLGGLPPPVAEDRSVDIEDEKHDGYGEGGGLPRPGGKRGKNPTVFGGNQNKSDQALAALMRSDSSALMVKLRSRRKKGSVNTGK